MNNYTAWFLFFIFTVVGKFEIFWIGSPSAIIYIDGTWKGQGKIDLDKIVRSHALIHQIVDLYLYIYIYMYVCNKRNRHLKA